ncbi:hypothetical protein MIR68_003541 [Amoeboaphelidium protococcarum]|nr:hypothetical protein MIR68_003541 [Amoeboaphelidium protococcarum]
MQQMQLLLLTIVALISLVDATKYAYLVLKSPWSFEAYELVDAERKSILTEFRELCPQQYNVLINDVFPACKYVWLQESSRRVFANRDSELDWCLNAVQRSSFTVASPNPFNHRWTFKMDMEQCGQTLSLFFMTD